MRMRADLLVMVGVESGIKSVNPIKSSETSLDLSYSEISLFVWNFRRIPLVGESLETRRFLSSELRELCLAKMTDHSESCDRRYWFKNILAQNS